MNKSTSQIIGRFAPSPSGRMHLGNAFSALIAWSSARSQGGRMVMRIEDLDPRTQDPQKARLVLDDLRWLGLDWDEGPYYQSERQNYYLDAIAQLDNKGLTYPCFCTRSELHAASAPHASDGTYIYQGTCRHLNAQEIAEKSLQRPPAKRLVVPERSDPNGTFDYDDLGYGHQHEILADDCGDFLIRRSDGVIAYQLAVVVDDSLMGVNEVVRGHDLLASSARQSYIARLLGFEPPRYGHVPLLVAPDGRRLSKRDGDLDLGALRARGIRPEQVIGSLAHAIDLAEAGEELTATQFVERFSWEAIRMHVADVAVDDSFILGR